MTLALDGGGAVFEAVVRLDLSGDGTFRRGAVDADERAGGGARLGADDLLGAFFVVRVGRPLERVGRGFVVPL